MADEAYLLSLALDASEHLAQVDSNLASLAEVILPDESEVSLLSVDIGGNEASGGAGDVDAVGSSSVEVPATFFDDLMSFQYMQTVTGFFVLAALLLNLGALLWLSFSDKWRS